LFERICARDDLGNEFLSSMMQLLGSWLFHWNEKTSYDASGESRHERRKKYELYFSCELSRWSFPKSSLCARPWIPLWSAAVIFDVHISFLSNILNQPFEMHPICEMRPHFDMSRIVCK
jgi:hypothetical protein